NWAARQMKHLKPMPRWRRLAQVSILVFILFVTILLRAFSVPNAIATILGIVFGVIGLGVMVLWSRKKGVMTHCITYCPIGLLATWLGKLNPFRIKITETCTECQTCHLVCYYDALKVKDIQNRRPGITCTLCGDCIGSCKFNSIEYRFLKLKPEIARSVFIVMAVVAHTVFLGMARI
ncbi:MAG: 4Fe-4S binding protein, partial [bacterium]